MVLVQDVEIRDRLAHSQINRFLYQYTCEACPKQSHANMVRALSRVESVYRGGEGGGNEVNAMRSESTSFSPTQRFVLRLFEFILEG